MVRARKINGDEKNIIKMGGFEREVDLIDFNILQ
jgi:hypothetical protein